VHDGNLNIVIRIFLWLPQMQVEPHSGLGTRGTTHW